MTRWQHVWREKKTGKLRFGTIYLVPTKSQAMSLGSGFQLHWRPHYDLDARRLADDGSVIEDHIWAEHP